MVEFDAPERHSALEHLIGRVRGPDVVREIGAAVGDDVVITHDGQLLFAYAATRADVQGAREAIEAVLKRDGVKGTYRVSHWDSERNDWHQLDPPLTGAAKLSEDAAERDADALETRTMVASTGKLIRAEVEQTMRAWAEKLNLQCEIVEHRHLLTTQVAFTVSGPKRKLDEFERGLNAEELATIRAERTVMLSPL